MTIIGRRKDAADWADTAYDDITTFLVHQAPRLQKALNEKPPLLWRIRTWLDNGIWDEVLEYGDIPAPASRSEGETITARLVADSVRKRKFLEGGPASAPGWRALADIEPTWVREGTLSWIAEGDTPTYSRTRINFEFKRRSALIELHEAASRAQTLREVCVQFGRRELPVHHLEVRLQRRYGAEILYRPN